MSFILQSFILRSALYWEHAVFANFRTSIVGRNTKHSWVLIHFAWHQWDCCLLSQISPAVLLNFAQHTEGSLASALLCGRLRAQRATLARRSKRRLAFGNAALSILARRCRTWFFQRRMWAGQSLATSGSRDTVQQDSHHHPAGQSVQQVVPLILKQGTN